MGQLLQELRRPTHAARWRCPGARGTPASRSRWRPVPPPTATMRGSRSRLRSFRHGPSEREHHLVAVEPDPHAADLRRAVGVHRDDVGEVRTFEDLASGVGEGDHPGRVERRGARSSGAVRLRRRARRAPRGGGRAHLVTDPDVMASHTVDWTGRWHGDADAVVRPADTEQVRGVVLAARAHRLALVPQGGNTGLVGGATPQGGEVVVDLRRLDELEPGRRRRRSGDRRRRGHAHPAAARTPRRSGLAARRWTSARGTPRRSGGWSPPTPAGCTCCATARCGRRCSASRPCSARGDVVRANLAGLLKDNTGYDLAGLLCGSEGTLGIVTRARLRLVPVPAQTGRGAARRSGRSPMRSAALPALRGRPALHAVEVMLAGGHRRRSPSTSATPFPLAPVPAVRAPRRAGRRRPAARARRRSSKRSTCPTTRPPRWPTTRARVGAPLALARGAPGGGRRARRGAQGRRDRAAARRWPSFVERGGPRRRAASRRVRSTLVYGHLADGNLHVNIVGPAADDERPDGRGARPRRCASAGA